MKNKLTSHLWFRLVIYFLLLSLAILALTQLFFNYSLDSHFSRYVQEQEDVVNRQIINAFTDYYENNMTWAGSQMAAQHISMSTGTWLVLYRPDGSLVFDALPLRSGHRMMERGPSRFPAGQIPEEYHYAFPLEVGGEEVGELFVTHLDRERGLWKEQDLLFREAMGASLQWTTLLAALLALMLSVYFARLLSRPLVDMAKAVKEVELGNLARRLPSYSIKEMEELSGSFNSLAAHLQKLESLRKRSTADFSHELRTPLTTLRSYLEAFTDGVLLADKENLKILHEEVMHLSRLVSDLEELSQAECNLLKDQRSDCRQLNISRFLKEKVAFFQPQFQGKDLQLELVLPHQELNARLDPLALGKIIGNLLYNAYKYTPPQGKVTVSLDGDAHGPQERVDQDMFLIEVRDNGIGINGEDLPYIFERFFRADPSRDRSSGGAGIGLALVKELVHACGGDIQVQSELGKGTTFYLYLPKT